MFVSWLTGLFDNYVIDGMVNRVSDMMLGLGARIRRLQTGWINGYLYVIVAAVTLVSSSARCCGCEAEAGRGGEGNGSIAQSTMTYPLTYMTFIPLVGWF